MIKVISFTKEPLTLMGEVASICWNSKPSKTIAKKCMESHHDRVLEFTDVILEIDQYSARMIRELYTHLIGVSRLQESTRYVEYGEFEFYTPDSVLQDPKALEVYNRVMKFISLNYKLLHEQGIPKEDIANILPLGMFTKIAFKINLRAILHMFELRTCTRTYKEYRNFMEELRTVLSSLDDDWKFIIDNYAKTKCDISGFCSETKSCGRHPK